MNTVTKIFGFTANCSSGDLSEVEKGIIARTISITNDVLKSIDDQKWEEFSFYCRYGHFPE